MKRNTDLDLIRAILIILMILIHIVSFGNAYPQLKAGILSFMMPTFLIITGYLVNIEKTGKQMRNYLKCLALPYVIMVTGFSVLSYFMPVRDGITELSLSQICEKIFVTSIGPYWFIQTMFICGILYYVSFKGATWGTLRQGKTTMSTTTSRFLFATLLLLLSKTPALSPSAAAYYFIGTAIRQCHIGFDRIFRPSPVALLFWIKLLGLEEWYDWGTLAIVFSCWCCISSLMWIHSLITRIQGKIYIQKIDNTLLYIGHFSTLSHYSPFSLCPKVQEHRQDNDGTSRGAHCNRAASTSGCLASDHHTSRLSVAKECSGSAKL